MRLCSEGVVLGLQSQHNSFQIGHAASQPLIVVNEPRIASNVTDQRLGHVHPSEGSVRAAKEWKVRLNHPPSTTA